MKIKVSEATPIQLDWLVAKCEGYTNLRLNPHRFAEPNEWIMDPPRVAYGPIHLSDRDYSTDWTQGGPIIERELIQTNPKWNNAGYEHPVGNWSWEAFVLGPNNLDDNFESAGPTPLIAAMRCFVASKLGEEVEVPDELM